MSKKVLVYDGISGEVYSVPIEGFKTSDEQLTVDIDEAISWLKLHDARFEYDEEGDIAVKSISWQLV